MACMEGYIITLITFLHFPFSNVSSRCLHNWTKNCINYNSFDFLRYGFSMVSPWHFYQSTKSHTNCICLAFLQCSMTPVTLVLLFTRRIIMMLMLVPRSIMFRLCMIQNWVARALERGGHQRTSLGISVSNVNALLSSTNPEFANTLAVCCLSISIVRMITSDVL